MSIQINKSAYEKLIKEDIEWLLSNTKDSLERRHIVEVLNYSPERLYASGSSEIPNDLEEAANNYLDGVYGKMPHSDYHTAIFIAGAKWQAEQDKETIELAEEHAYLAGAVNEREKIMKEAVEGKVGNIIIHENGDEVHYSITYPKGKNQYSINDKVKIIIL